MEIASPPESFFGQYFAPKFANSSIKTFKMPLVSCEICNRFLSPSSLKAHKFKQHGVVHKQSNTKNLHQCSICSEEFAFTLSYIEHLNNIHGDSIGQICIESRQFSSETGKFLVLIV